jgi:hypothetical protein
MLQELHVTANSMHTLSLKRKKNIKGKMKEILINECYYQTPDFDGLRTAKNDTKYLKKLLHIHVGNFCFKLFY